MERTTVAGSWTSFSAWMVGFGLTYFAGAEVGHLLSYEIEEQAFATFWPPAGIYLACLVITRRISLWPALVVAACIANLLSDVVLHEKSMAVSFAFSLANTVEACVGACLLRRFIGSSLSLTSVKDIVGLVGFAALLSPALGATIGTTVVAVTFDNASFGSTWRTWWMADAIGVLVVAPLVLTGSVQQAVFWQNSKVTRFVEGMALFAGLFVVSVGVYGDYFPLPYNVPALLLPFLLWSAVRFDGAMTAVALLMVGLIGIWNTSRGLGPYSALPHSPGDQMLRAQGTLSVISLCVWLLAALVAERRKADQDGVALIAKLQKALTEIKTLRGLIPICAWCKKIRDDKDYWHSVEDYIGDHTEARFSHGMCPACYEGAIQNLPKDASDSAQEK